VLWELAHNSRPSRLLCVGGCLREVHTHLRCIGDQLLAEKAWQHHLPGRGRTTAGIRAHARLLHDMDASDDLAIRGDGDARAHNRVCLGVTYLHGEVTQVLDQVAFVAHRRLLAGGYADARLEHITCGAYRQARFGSASVVAFWLGGAVASPLGLCRIPARRTSRRAPGATRYRECANRTPQTGRPSNTPRSRRRQRKSPRAPSRWAC
jgi:hypothetical protein